MKTLRKILLPKREREAIKAAVKLLRKPFPVEKSILFGSKARGDYGEESTMIGSMITAKKRITAHWCHSNRNRSKKSSSKAELF